MAKNDTDWDIQYLLDLDRYRVSLDNGYWWTIRACKTEASEERPHGLKYSLTFHGPNDERILGIDNAHAVDTGTGPAKKSRRVTTYDHKHQKGKEAVPYEFTSPMKLVEDFFAMIEAYLEEEELS